MPRPKNPIPSYLHHKPTDRAYVKIGKVFTYLGKYGTKESKEQYVRLMTKIQKAPQVTLAKFRHMVNGHGHQVDSLSGRQWNSVRGSTDYRL